MGEIYVMKKFALQATALALTLTAVVGWAARPVANASADLLQFLPDGSGVILVDFQKVIASSLWSSGQKSIKDTLEKIEPGIADLINPTDIQTMAVAIQGLSMDNVVAVATGSFNQSAVLARLKADTKIRVSTEKYKNIDVHLASSVGTGSKNDVTFAFYDASTVIVGKSAGVRASIDTKLGERASMAQNAKLTGALAEVPPSAIKFALVPTPAMTTGLQSNDLPFPDFASIKLVFGAVDLASGLDLTAILRTDTGEQAKSIAERLNGLLSMAKGYLGAAGNTKLAPAVEALKTINITNADADVRITGSVPMDLLNSLLGSKVKG
jgi:hypothetical protein